MTPRPRWALRVLLAAASLSVGLVLVEVALRWRAPPGAPQPAPLELADGTRQESLTVPDERLMYRAAPDVEFLGYYRTNSRGWRGPEPAAKLPPGALRVACLGDSSTMGLGVREEQAWPFRLERMLARALPFVPAVEVLDLGTTGYSSWQNRAQLEHELAGLDVDLVVVMPTGVNDASPTTGATDGEVMGGVARGPWWRRTRLATALGFGVATTSAARPRVSEDEFVANVEAMVELAAARELPLVLVAAATSAAGRARGPRYARSAEQVARIARRHGLPLADVRPDFEAAEPVAFFVDPVHPDPLGHGLIAARVFETCVARGLLDGAPGVDVLAAWLAARDGRVDAERLRPLLTAATPSGAVALGGEGLWRLRALRARNDGRLDDATFAEERAELWRAHIVPRDGLASWCERLPGGDPAQLVALARWEDHVFGRPRGRDRRVALARAHHVGGHPGVALAWIEEALALRPDDAEALALQVDVLDGLGWHAALDVALARFGEDEPSTAGLAIQGRRRFRAGCLPEAEASLREALELEPLHLESRYLLGRVLMKARRLDEAAFHLATALSVSAAAYPDIPEMLERIAAVPAARRASLARRDG